MTCTNWTYEWWCDLKFRYEVLKNILLVFRGYENPACPYNFTYECFVVFFIEIEFFSTPAVYWNLLGGRTNNFWVTFRTSFTLPSNALLFLNSQFVSLPFTKVFQRNLFSLNYKFSSTSLWHKYVFLHQYLCMFPHNSVAISLFLFKSKTASRS